MADDTMEVETGVYPRDPELELSELGGEFDDDQPTVVMTEPVMGEPLEEGWSTGQKVGVAAGVTGLLGLAGWGLWKLGSHEKWWGQPQIVIDDIPAPGGGSGGGGGGGGGGSSSSSRKRATGKPPNISGDPKGFNSTLWPAPGPVRLALRTQGYKVEITQEPLVDEGESHPKVRQLQNDWNKVIKAIDAGRVKLPSNVDHPELLKHYRGLLKADGIPGKNSLNALEIIFTNYRDNGVFWSKLKEQA